MKITVERTLLLKALSHAQSIVEKRQTIPILANVLLLAEGDMLTLRATDSELEISEQIAASVEEGGSVTAPARKLYEIVNKLPDGSQVNLVLSENKAQVTVSCGRSRFSLPTLTAEEFPTMTQSDMPTRFTLASPELLYLINNTSFAVSVEETRYNLNGIYVHAHTVEGANVLRAVATDGHRLACADVSLPDGAANMAGSIIPRKTIAEVSKLVSGTENPVEIAASAQQICFKIGDVVLVSRLIDGQYPDYEKVIPTGNDKVMEVEADALATVIERVSVVSEKTRGVKIMLQKNLLRAYMMNPDEGTAEDEVEVAYEGEDFETGFNFRYLLDILNQLKGTVVQVSFLEMASPIVLKDAKKAGVLFVLMPMRV